MIKSELKRSKRKTIMITVDNSCRVIVKAPLKMPMSDINKFLQEKEGWIKQKIDFYSELIYQNQDVLDYSKIAFLGNYYKPSFAQVSHIAIEDDNILFPKRLEKDKSKFLTALKKFYKEVAKEYLTSKTLMQATILNLPFSQIKITDAKKRWGSCDSEGNLSFNLRVILLPPHIVDYIIIHELAHLKHLNHSPKFWQTVEGFLPNHKLPRQELKKYTYLMNLLRK